jgi:hypothetical protein
MSKRKNSIQNTIPAIWLIGLGLLWMFDLWWPGILILIGVTMLIGVIGRGTESTPAAEPAKDEPKIVDVAPVPEPQDVPIPQPEEVVGATNRLPKTCPMCGGPVDERKVKWLGPEEARCPFCDSKLPLGLVE